MDKVEKNLSDDSEEQRRQLVVDEVLKSIVSPKVKSSFYLTHYQPLMKGSQLFQFDECIQWLKQSNICFQQSSSATEDYGFRLKFIKTDWESATYQVTFRKFSSTLQILMLKLKSQEFTQLYGPLIGKGKFGSVYQINKQSSVFAVKNIKITKEQYQNDDIGFALKQVFISKIVSAIKVGPKFHNLFGYDALVFEDGVQFVMQYCKEVNPSTLQNLGQLESSLFNQLKILHSFSICHCDIKQGNLGWSSNFGKPIFLDFGFSDCLKQPLGYKSKTYYKGTFAFSSPQMKKVYFLRQSEYIDLYYNDLYSLNLMIKSMKFQIQYFANQMGRGEFFYLNKTESDQVSSQSFQSAFGMKIYKPQILLKFVLLKYHVYNRNTAQILIFIENEQVLVKTFRKIVLDEIRMPILGQSTLPFLFQQANNILTKQSLKAELQISQELDRFFLFYSNQNVRGVSPTFFKLVSICQAENGSELIKQIWLDENYMEGIFWFIDIYSNPNDDLNQKREKLYQILHEQTQGASKKSKLVKFRDILLFFFNYFLRYDNIEILSRIQCYFVNMSDFETMQSMQAEILEKVIRKADLFQYIRRNLEYFLGKKLIELKVRFDISTSNELKLKSLLSNKQINLDSPLKQFLKATIQVVEVLSNSPSDQVHHQTFCRYKQKYSKIVRSDIISALQLLLTQLPSQTSITKKLSFENLFLACSFFKMEIEGHVQRYEIDKVNKISNLQPFYRQFKLFYRVHDTKLSVSDRSFIVMDFIETAQPQRSHLYQRQLQFLTKHLSKVEAHRFILNYTKDVEIRKAGSLKALLKSTQRIFRLLSCLVVQEFKKVYLEILDDLLNIYSDFNAYAHKKTFQLRLSSEQNNKEVCDNLLQYIELNSCLIKLAKNNNEGLQDLVELILSQGQLEAAIILGQIFFKGIENQMIQNFLYQFFVKILQEKKLNLLLMTPRLLIIAIGKYLQEAGIEQCFYFLLSYAGFLYCSQINWIDTEIIATIQKVISITSVKQQIKIIQKVCEENILSFKESFIVTILVFHFYLANKHKLNSQTRRRILIICVFYVEGLKEGLKEGCYQKYKAQLMKQTTQSLDASKRRQRKNNKIGEKPKQKKIMKILLSLTEKKLKKWSKNLFWY